jgi:diaminopimelate epimerase
MGKTEEGLTQLIPFHKYQGTGNDFILMEDADGSLEFLLTRRWIAHLCDRRFGIGADGLILLQKTAGYDFRMVYYNADGAESSFCGNGSRCIVAHAHRLGWIRQEAWFVASDGDHEAVVHADGTIAVHMRSVKDWQWEAEDLILDTGSPHYIRIMDQMPLGDIVEQAQRIRYNPIWKAVGINVNFLAQVGDQLHVRTYERGVEGETLSCGTGVTASALAWAIQQKHTGLGRVTVVTPGGQLSVNWEAGTFGFRDVWLSGPALRVFGGEVQLEDLKKSSST